MVVSEVELPESRQSGGPHPDLEVLVGHQVWELRVLCAVPGRPVGRRVHVRRTLVACGAVLFVLVRPSDTLVRKGIRLVLSVGAVEEDRLGEGV